MTARPAPLPVPLIVSANEEHVRTVADQAAAKTGLPREDIAVLVAAPSTEIGKVIALWVGADEARLERGIGAALFWAAPAPDVASILADIDKDIAGLLLEQTVEPGMVRIAAIEPPVKNGSTGRVSLLRAVLGRSAKRGLA